MKNSLPFVLFMIFLTGTALHAQQDSFPNFPPAEHRLFGFMNEEKNVIKIDLLNIVKTTDGRDFSGVISIGYEQKLSTTWSLNGEVSTAFGVVISPGSKPKTDLGSGQVGVSFGPRFYYNLKQRIGAGTSVNNLSANYFALNIGTRLIQISPGWTATDNTPHFAVDNITIAPLYGFQRRIFKIGYFDINFGFKFSHGDPIRSQVNVTPGVTTAWQFFPITNLRLGIAI